MRCDDVLISCDALCCVVLCYVVLCCLLCNIVLVWLVRQGKIRQEPKKTIPTKIYTTNKTQIQHKITQHCHKSRQVRGKAKQSKTRLSQDKSRYDEGMWPSCSGVILSSCVLCYVIVSCMYVRFQSVSCIFTNACELVIVLCRVWLFRFCLLYVFLSWSWFV
jgi:hypothetical protein